MKLSTGTSMLPITFLATLLATSVVAAEPKEEEQAVDEKKDEESKVKAWWTDHMKIKGDFRYRFEIIDKEEKDLRYRHRIRARLGIFAEVVDQLDAAVQLGTGGADDPVSNNQSLTESFSSKPIWLDLAYFDYHPSWAEGLKLVGGKMKNPFYRVGKTELQWDPDLNPEGLAIAYRRELGQVEPFLAGAGFWLDERKEDDDAWLLGAQAGIKLKFLDGKFYILAGGGYMDFTHIKGKEVFWDAEDSYGNTASVDPSVDPAVDPDLADILYYDNDFNEINAFGEIGGKIVKIPWAVFTDFVVNVGADEYNTGWLVGGLLGKAKEQFDFHLRYIYREVERDAVVGLLTDSDFVGGGTDGKGHEANFVFQLAKGVQAAVTYFYNQTPIHDDTLDYHRAQIDLKLKF